MEFDLTEYQRRGLIEFLNRTTLRGVEAEDMVAIKKVLENPVGVKKITTKDDAN